MYKKLISFLLLVLPISASALSPSQREIRACFSDTSIPDHFSKATDVLIGRFQEVSDPTVLGVYKVTKVWKGNIKVGSVIKFQLPPYGSQSLTAPGESYLFFLKPKNVSAGSNDPVYVQASCYQVHPIAASEWSPDTMSSKVRIIESQTNLSQ